jgi:hypothetical protein
MGVGWIEHINNNSAETWYIKSVNSGNNGALSGGKGHNESTFSLNDNDFHPLSAKTNYAATSCGIPGGGTKQPHHFKMVSKNPTNGHGVLMFTFQGPSGPNYIMFVDARTNKKIARMSVASDFTCNLVLESDGPAIKLDKEFASTVEVNKQGWQALGEGEEISAVLAPYLV